MKIFLTGGTGFIGSHLIVRAQREGHELVALRRPRSRPCIALGNEPNWLEKPLDAIGADDLTGIDALVHLASVGVTPKVASWEEMFYWNVTVTLRLLNAAHQASVKRVVVAGSYAEYGRAADRYEFIPVDAPLLPVNGYAASKAAASIAAMTLAQEMGMELFYLRIFSAFGEGQYEKNFWPALRQAALAGRDFPMTPGGQIRDYIPVERVAADVLEFAAEVPSQGAMARTVNVGSGVPVTMLEFAETWWKKWGAKGKLLPGAIPYRPNEPMRFVPVIETRNDS